MINPDLHLMPEVKGFSVPRRVCAVYGGAAAALSAGAYLLWGREIGLLLCCVFLCGFVWLDLVLERKNQFHQSARGRSESLPLRCLVLAGTAACVALLIRAACAG